MLVRFLSFAASVLGSARHRAILISCLAVIFAFSSVMGLTLFHNRPSTNSASARGSGSDTDNETPLWLSGQQVDDKDKVRSNAKDKADQPTTTAPTAPDNNVTQEGTTPAPVPELSLSAETVTLVENKGQLAIRHTGVSAALTWEVTLHDAPTDQLKLDKTDSALHISAAETATAGTYTLTIHADITDSDGNVTKVTKTVNVILPAPQQ